MVQYDNDALRLLQQLIKDNLLYVFDGCVERDSPTKGPDNDGLGAQHHLQDTQLSDEMQKSFKNFCLFF